MRISIQAFLRNHKHRGETIIRQHADFKTGNFAATQTSRGNEYSAAFQNKHVCGDVQIERTRIRGNIRISIQVSLAAV